MKRILTTLLFAGLLLPQLSSAQLGNIGVDAGLKLGANFSNINGKYWENGYKANFLGGAFVSVNGPRIGVQVEAIFSQSSYATGNGFHDIYKDFYNNIADSAKKGNFRVNYLSIPVLLNLKLFSKVIIQVGPQYSGVVSINDKDALLKDAKGLFKSGSVDGVIGLWVNLPANLNVGARYVIGFSNLNDEDGNTTVQSSQRIDDSWKQRTLQVHLGYTIF